jgi:predicted nucleic-acid-binding protein
MCWCASSSATIQRKRKKAERAFFPHAKGDGIFVSLLVLAEVGWVLSVAYQWDRATLHDRLSRLARTRGVVVEDLDLVESALAGFRVGKADLADYLILGKAQGGGGPLLTFDKRLGRLAFVREDGVATIVCSAAQPVAAVRAQTFVPDSRAQSSISRRACPVRTD